MLQRSPPKKKSPPKLGSDQAGEFKRDYIYSVAAALDAGKAKHDKIPRRLQIWPKLDHPFAAQLCEDCNFVWRRLTASVRLGGID